LKHACDCHVQVFGTQGKYPYWKGRTYTPAEASVEQLLALHERLGMERVVIVQPSAYGTDNTCTVDALRRLGSRARGVAVIDRNSNLVEKHAVGIRGVRVNLQTAGEHKPALARQALQQAAARVAPFGWHVQVFTNLDVIQSLESDIAALPVPLVVDHFGLPDSLGGFDALLRLVKAGRVYVKLSAPHRFSEDPAPIAKALLDANPDRLLWGTDWPHPAARHHVDPSRIEPFDDIDDAAALARLRAWAGKERLFHKILVENPARLYDF
jgi:predicted TIM-barrel fold metal-dependent hydrolase